MRYVRRTDCETNPTTRTIGGGRGGERGGGRVGEGWGKGWGKGWEKGWEKGERPTRRDEKVIVMVISTYQYW